jgi:hypothetical protein
MAIVVTVRRLRLQSQGPILFGLWLDFHLRLTFQPFSVKVFSQIAQASLLPNRQDLYFLDELVVDVESEFLFHSDRKITSLRNDV